MQIAVINVSRAKDPDVALMAEACNAQVMECARAWDIAPTPVVFYSKADGLPAGECRNMIITDALDVPNALGYHDNDLGFIYGRVLEHDGPDGTSVTLSHECLEMLVDPACASWRALGGGRSIALEVCDPVQGDQYAQQASVGDLVRDVWLSNYVTPRYFDPAGVGAFDRMGTLSAPLTMSAGGYQILREKNGDIVNVFARTRPGATAARLTVADKIGRPGSRTLRRLRGDGR